MAGRSPALLACLAVILAAGMVASMEEPQVADLGVVDLDSALVEVGESHQGNQQHQSVQMLQADSDENAPRLMESVGNSSSPLNSGNPFTDPDQGPAGVNGDASDPSAGTSAPKSEYDKKRTQDTTEPELEKDADKESSESHKKNTIDEHIDFKGSQPLSLAGTSGAGTECAVKDDTVTVSGKGECACLFESSLIFGQTFAVEIGFDLEFENPGAGGRHGGIFYGASQNTDTRENNPVVDWTDEAPGKGYRVYGNKDVNKLEGMSPGPDPNKRWRITINPDRTAEFTAGPKTWVQTYQPLMTGRYFGFFTSGGTKLKITNVSVRKALAREQNPETEPKVNGNKIVAEEGYGVGTARLFYSETGGRMGQIMPKSVYLEGKSLQPRDFRTQVEQPGDIGGDVMAATDLHAGRFVKIEAASGLEAADGFKTTTDLFYVQDGKGSLKDNSVYLARGNLEAESGSVISTNNMVAGKNLLLGAADMNGKSGDEAVDAEFWYAEIGKEDADIAAQTLYLRKGSFATSAEDIVAKEDVVAGEYLTVGEDPTSGDQVGRFWYSEIGRDDVKSETVYVQNSNFATAEGNVMSQGDISVGRHVKIAAKKFYGEGEGKLFYVAQSSGKYSGNALYTPGALGTDAGSIEASKDLVTNRYLKIGTGDAKSTDGGADLWYCHRSTSDGPRSNLVDKSLYLKSGDFRTAAGSIYSQKDLVATRELFFSSSGDAFSSVKSARARLWYAHRDSGDVAGDTLYLRNGNFATQLGSIHSPEDLVTSKYVSINAMEGFATVSTDEAQLFYSAKEEKGSTESVMYLKKGDLRLEDGSVYTSEISASGSVQLQAQDGYGDGSASMFYVDTPFGASTYNSKSLYLKGTTDLRVDNVFATKDLVSFQAVQIGAFDGFGGGDVELWYGKQGGDAGALNTALFSPDTTYVRTGDFATQKGDLAAALDVETQKGVFTLAAKGNQGSGQSKDPDRAELWYSHTGSSPAIGSKSLYLRKGDFATVSGSIEAKNIRAQPELGALKAPSVHLKDEMKCKTCEFKKVLIVHGQGQVSQSPTEKTPLHAAPDNGAQAQKVPKVLQESLVLLDEGNAASTGKTHAIDLGLAINKLTARHEVLRSEEALLVEKIAMVSKRLAAVEGRLRQ